MAHRGVGGLGIRISKVYIYMIFLVHTLMSSVESIQLDDVQPRNSWRWKRWNFSKNIDTVRWAKSASSSGCATGVGACVNWVFDMTPVGGGGGQCSGGSAADNIVNFIMYYLGYPASSRG